MKRLAIITSHPIQYNAPLFSLLEARSEIQLKVFYTWGEGVLKKKFDPGFGKEIKWDIPLTSGYEHEFLENIANDPGSHHFSGIDNPSIIKKIESWKPDALLLYGWSFKSHLKVLRYFNRKIPIFFRGDSTLLNEGNSFKSIIRKIFLSWVYKNVDVALYVGTHNKNYYLKFGLKKKQLLFAPHAVDNNRFKIQSLNQQIFVHQEKERLHIGEEDIVFLYAGKLDDNKNIAVLVAAFIKIQVPITHLIIAGNGVNEFELKRMVSNYSNIHFKDFVNQQEMPSLYGLCDVFVLPSKTETWGLGINEAMSCGKAVIASTGCGASIDLIEEGINGFTFPPANVDALANCMKFFVKHKQQAIEMGKHSLKKINDWSFEKISLTIEDLMAKYQQS